MVTRKRFGQHFLHDPRVIADILTDFAPDARDVVVEIGPGEGVLTRRLIGRVGVLHAIEIDRDLATRLADDPALSGLVLHCADALEIALESLVAPGTQARVIGNLPYYVSSPLLFHVFEAGRAVSDALVMLQREVAERLLAAPDSGAYGRLSVMAQFYAQARLVRRVAPGAFRPPPDVQSAVVHLYPRTTRLCEDRLIPLFSDLVRQAFGQRRKTLRRSLAGAVPGEVWEMSGIDAGRRPETLSVAEFIGLAQASDVMRSTRGPWP